MRNIDQLRSAKSQYEQEIERLSSEDDLFPDDPIHTNTIEVMRGVITYLDRKIADLVGN